MNILSFVAISIAYWIFCVIWFSLLQKPVFGIYNRMCAQNPIKSKDVVRVYSHGNISDCIIASYLTAIPLMIGMVASMVCGVGYEEVVTAYNVVISIAMGLLVVSDTALYRFWKFKIDSSVFFYLKSPKGAAASVSTAYLIVAFICWMLLSTTFFFGSEITIEGVMMYAPLPDEYLSWWGYLVVVLLFVLVTGVLFVIIRGLGIRPNNLSTVYFSSDPFLNHWALNPMYGFIYSLSVKDDYKDRFQTMPQQECDDIIKELFPTNGTPKFQLLKTKRPNILLVIWESLSAEYSEFWSGKHPTTTPCLDALAKESVVFTNCTASGFRTDRGLVGILSGYPAQPTASIMRHTRKLPNLPGLARTLKANGYSTMVVHGGDLAVMHQKEYYLASGHEKVIEQKDMPSNLPTCKWGIQDGNVMQLVCDEIASIGTTEKPYFITLQTLSSHEPFDVPLRVFPNDKVRDSFAYTDKSLGEFVESLKASGAWDDLLMIVVADHGLNLPKPVTDHKEHSHIPMLFTGGVIKAPMQIDTPISQSDLAATLLGQLGIDHDEYIFSRDILADTYTKPFGAHVFHNGIMLADAEGVTVVDTQLNKILEGEGNTQHRQYIDAILQKTYQDLADR